MQQRTPFANIENMNAHHSTSNDFMLSARENNDINLAIARSIQDQDDMSFVNDNDMIDDTINAVDSNIIDDTSDNMIDDATVNSQSNMPRKQHTHIDFIIGRGRKFQKGNLNIPLNPQLQQRNLVFVDPDVRAGSDICRQIQKVDFSEFGITKDHDPNENIQVRFLFDWSSFYCGAMQSMLAIAMKLQRKFQILVPLYAGEHMVPRDVIRSLSHPIFTITTAEGQYPLFNWSSNRLISDSSFNPGQTMDKIINPNRYILIFAYL